MEEFLNSEIFQTAASAGISSGAAAFLGFRIAIRELYRRLALLEARSERHDERLGDVERDVAVLNDRADRDL